MDGGSLLDLVKVWLNLVFGLVSLLAFSTLVDTTIVFVNKELSMLLCVLGLAVFCLVHAVSDKMGEIHNNGPVSKKLILRPWLCSKDLVSMQQIVLHGVKLLKSINLLLGFLITSRDCERHVDRGPIQMSPLYNKILSPPLC